MISRNTFNNRYYDLLILHCPSCITCHDTLGAPVGVCILLVYAYHYSTSLSLLVYAYHYSTSLSLFLIGSRQCTADKV